MDKQEEYITYPSPSKSELVETAEKVCKIKKQLLTW